MISTRTKRPTRSKLPKRPTKRPTRTTRSSDVPRHVVRAFERRLDGWTVKLVTRSLRLHALALRRT